MTGEDGKTVKQRGMVRWYSPVLLARTGARAIVAGVFGQFADARDVQPALDPAGRKEINGRHDYSGRDGIWIDYVADLGDGWQPTYAVALQLARPRLTLDDRLELPRGDMLVMGGDQVYPDASSEAYRERLLAPYEAASAEMTEEPDLYAIPGNHDWYDGLTSFMGLFCRRRDRDPAREGRKVGAWCTQQARSYFSIKLPYRWWLWGVDIQLNDYIDRGQIDYFRSIDLEPDDNVILCTAKPGWIYGTRLGRKAYRNISYMAGLVEARQAHVAALISGDIHHYSRYEPEDGEGPQLITAGGGGAFLHPTHRLPPSVDLSLRPAPSKIMRFRRPCTAVGHTNPSQGEPRYPDGKTSWWLAWRNLFFLWRNPEFALGVGAVYAVLAWALATVGQGQTPTMADWILGRVPAPSGFWNFAGGVAAMFERNPFLGVAVVAVLTGMVLFCDSTRWWKRLLVGGAHGLLQLGVACAVASVAAQVNRAWWRLEIGEPWATLSLVGEAFIIGGIAGATLLGLYLVLALNLLGLHWNAAFSALRIADYKNFLRMHLDAGGLTIFPIGIDKARAPEPRLIEPPISIVPR